MKQEDLYVIKNGDLASWLYIVNNWKDYYTKEVLLSILMIQKDGSKSFSENLTNEILESISCQNLEEAFTKFEINELYETIPSGSGKRYDSGQTYSSLRSYISLIKVIVIVITLLIAGLGVVTLLEGNVLLGVSLIIGSSVVFLIGMANAQLIEAIAEIADNSRYLKSISEKLDKILRSKN